METSPKFYALGLRLGILGENDVQSWVNREIETCDAPSEIIMELAFSPKSGIQNAYSLLSSIPDESDQFEVLRKLLSAVSDADLENLEFCGALAEKLYSIWVEADYRAPEDLNLIGFFDDEYSLAQQGLYGSLDEWHEEFKRFLRGFR